jgi:hypothetical protein
MEVGSGGHSFKYLPPPPEGQARSDPDLFADGSVPTHHA